ncbi:hypothetical protein [Prevotella corporis]|uniref:hypothetical protein n=1 Tax=Prevotella corporis TaxID=28128 RepID=UPI0023FA4377|nr:hypothetical protein [Prevotella corporis]
MKISDNIRSSILYSNQTCNVVINNYPDSVLSVPTGKSIVDDSLACLMSPVNPLTGFRDDTLTRLMSPNIPTKEREFILNNLSHLKGYDSPASLTVQDILEVLPSRYIQDPVEISRYEEYIKSMLDDLKQPHVEDVSPTTDSDQSSSDPVPTDTDSSAS